MKNFKNVVIVVVSFAVIGLAGNVKAVDFKINSKSVITFKQKVKCDTATSCMALLKAAKKDYKNVTLSVGKKVKHIVVTVRADCTKECFNDVNDFIASNGYKKIDTTTTTTTTTTSSK